MTRPRIALPLVLITLLALLVASAAPAAGETVPEKCFHESVRRHKESLGVHQWTIRLATRWCAGTVDGRPQITSVNRRVTVRTGTNWKLVSRNLASERDRRTATSYADFHFRLRYPYFEQHCYPRLEIHMTARGASQTHRRTGC